MNEDTMKKHITLFCSTGLGLCGMAGLVFIALESNDVISWPWLWVLSPCWIGFIFLILCGLSYVVAVALFEKKPESSDQDALPAAELTLNSPMHLAELEMLRDQIAADIDKLRDELDNKAPATEKRARIIGMRLVLRGLLSEKIDPMLEGWRKNEPQSRAAEVILNGEDVAFDGEPE